ECNGSRIRLESSYVKVAGLSIQEMTDMPISELIEFFASFKPSKHDKTIAKRILLEIDNRLQTMMDVGLGYLTLNRLSNTLSGGETQRINLTRSLGSNLTDSLYILDEPSVGLHPRDTERLIHVLQSLRNLGNAVLVVEHDEEMMTAADFLIDMGPHAGRNGGELIYAGPSDKIGKAKNSLTAEYLSGRKEISVPANRRKGINKIEIIGASQFNLKDIDVTIPLNTLTVVTGVSGSGKTTLIKKILYPAIQRLLEGYGERPGTHKAIEGDLKKINAMEMVDQNPLGRSSRSNPVTYIKAYDAIRDFYSKQQLSKVRGYKPKHFSFNVDGGRCDLCKGEGEVVVEMQFLADIHLPCESCKGKKFKNEVLEVRHNEKNIHDILEMTVDEAMEFFEDVKEIRNRIKPLQDIGLGYVQLGQSSSTLSGGEAQRVKLASFLGKGKSTEHVVFIFDEPTTGLHFHDIHKLLLAFNKLIEAGHSVIVIEHHMDVIKCADWVIDLGPEGGSLGGDLLYQGPPEGLLDVERSHTGKYLKEKLI
ncbi:MAG: excinuclease ABC subunit UvrA, partial [Chitinophagales bacterium]|nr:excinuclease ABC subunit UvrA [Chitinophagales bacterium]